MEAAKRFNAWQIIGVVLILVGLSYVIYRETGTKPAHPVEPTAPPSQVLPQEGVRVPSH